MNEKSSVWGKIENCPRCHKKAYGYPALSRHDNKTYICSECGVAEAMEDFLGIEYPGEKYWVEDNHE